MVSSGQHGNLLRYDVQKSASAAQLHAVLLNESESFFYRILEKMRLNNTRKEMKHINEESHPGKCSDDAYGMILVDFHGRLGNNLFEVAFAKRIAEQLGCKWQVIYRGGWAPTFNLSN